MSLMRVIDILFTYIFKSVTVVNQYQILITAAEMAVNTIWFVFR